MPVEMGFRGQRICVGFALACAAFAWCLTLNPNFELADKTFESALPATVWGLTFLSALLFFASHWGTLKGHAIINPLLAVAVNLLGSLLIFNLNIPLYLDTAGTMFIAILYGPILGMGTSVLSVSLGAVSNPLGLAYVPNAVIVAYLVGWMARRGVFKRMIATLLSGYGLGIVAGLVSLGSTLVALDENLQRGPRELTNFYLLIVHDETVAALLQALSSDPIDKAFTLVLVCLAIRFAPKPLRYFFDRPETHPAVGRVLTEDRFTLSLDEEPAPSLLDRLQRYL